MSMTNKSEVAQLRERIALEYQAVNRVFTDFTPTARHEFIIKRQENIAACFEELQQYMDPEAAMELIIQLGNQIQGSSASSGNTG
jgi:hypothetical protein